MAGGTFTTAGRVRPGVYINFESGLIQVPTTPERGTVIVPLLEHNWGAVDTFVEITPSTSSTTLRETWGYDTTDSQLLLLTEALKNASKVLTYRPGGGTQATSGILFGDLVLTAAHSGTRGNDLSVDITANPSSGFDVTLTLGTTTVLDLLGLATIADLKAEDTSAWFTVAGTDATALQAVSATSFTGGTTLTQTNSHITTFLDNTETQDFDTLCFPEEDSTLQAAFKSKIVNFRETIGKYVTGVTSNFDTADYEGIYNVKNGYSLSGSDLSAKQATAWLAGAVAGAQASETLTYKAVSGAIDANARFTHDATVAALNAGQIVFSVQNNNVVVEQERNSLTTFTSIKDSRFGKGRIIRALDTIGNRLSALTPGRYNNNADGQAIVRQIVIDILLDEQDNNVVQNVDVENDYILDEARTTGDELWATVRVQPVDSIEKYYFTVRVN